jgi:hypothetical protein
VGRAADREDDALQRASSRWGASSASSDSSAERFQRGWVGGRSDPQCKRA